jgi:hypothetical protein
MVPDKGSAQNFGAARARGFALAWAFDEQRLPQAFF